MKIPPHEIIARRVHSSNTAVAMPAIVTKINTSHATVI